MSNQRVNLIRSIFDFHLTETTTLAGQIYFCLKDGVKKGQRERDKKREREMRSESER